MKRAVLPLILALVLGSALALPSSAATPTCATSGPGGYTVTVCVEIEKNDVLDRRVPVPITATATGGEEVGEVEVFLSGSYLLTDYESPWEFDLPTRLWVDGPYRIQVQAVIEGDPEWTSARTIVPVTFENGITVPPSSPNTFTPPNVPDPPAGQPITVAAVADGASGETTPDQVADLIGSWDPDLLLYAGDVYRDGTPTEFLNWYDDRGGRFGHFRDITAPTPGNHEYQTAGAAGYFDYWDNPPHYYSFEANGWHVISLDSNTQVGQGVSSAQYQWLQDDLAASDADCTVATFHHPRFSIGKYSSGSSWMQPIWALMASEGVDLVVNGHDHNYQRWKPLNAAGIVDHDGMRQFIVGTGGHESYPFSRSDARVVEAQRVAGGALRFSFWRARTSFAFVAAGGATLDSGSFRCSADDTTPPSAPGNVVATVTDPFHVQVDWSASSDAVGVVGYDVYRGGQLLRADVSATQIVDDTVEPGDSLSYTVVAKDAAGNESPPGGPATADVPGFLFWDGFESGTMSAWTFSQGISVVSGSPPAQHGARSARMISAGTATFATEQLASNRTELFMRAAFLIESQGDNGVDLLRFRTSTGAGIATVVVNSQDRVALFDERSGITDTSTTLVAPGWHEIQLKVVVAGASSRTAVWLDGGKIDALSVRRDLGFSPIGRVQLGDARTARTYDVRFDDVAVSPTLIRL